MADIEQRAPFLATFERKESRCQIVQLADRRGIGNAQSIPFLVQAYVDGHTLRATAETAKVAFAKAIEWHVVERLADVSISDGTGSYSIAEFSSVMALIEIASTIEADIKADA
jgi:hypothetical protein